MGKAKPRKSKPETPQAHEVRAVPGPKPFIDTQAHIRDPLYPFSVSCVRPDLLESHVKGQDWFRVIQSVLYYQIASPTYPVVEFICWLRDAYDEHRDLFLSAQGNKILQKYFELIKEALCFPTPRDTLSSLSYLFPVSFPICPGGNKVNSSVLFQIPILQLSHPQI